MDYCPECNTLRNSLSLSATKRAERKLRAYQYIQKEPRLIKDVSNHIGVSIRNTRRYLQEMKNVLDIEYSNGIGSAYLHKVKQQLKVN